MEKNKNKSLKLVSSTKLQHKNCRKQIFAFKKKNGWQTNEQKFKVGIFAKSTTRNFRLASFSVTGHKIFSMDD